MPAAATVIGALRRFLPDFLKTAPPLSREQRRAIWAITHCRTAAMGGRAFGCGSCQRTHFAWHSCNHKACPQCGRKATADWVGRELRKRINAPYFLVTFTLPSQLRSCFFGPFAREAYDLFFAAASGALSQKLATAKGLRAQVNGFTAVLHTWNQRMGFHPHIHCLVPGAGLDAKGRLTRVKRPNFLVYLPHLQSAFRQHLYQLFKKHDWQVDPDVWSKDWGVHIQPAGNGASAVKYLGAYVARTAISDSRLLKITGDSVALRWKNRERNRTERLTLAGVEFARRYLRHVLPRGLRSIRYYGFCHPAARRARLRVQFHSGMAVQMGATTSPRPQEEDSRRPRCPWCEEAAAFLFAIQAPHRQRGPPRNGAKPIAIALALTSRAA